jgi:hypothetical protein
MSSRSFPVSALDGQDEARLLAALDKSLWLDVYCKLQRSRTPALLPRTDSIGAKPQR